MVSPSLSLPCIWLPLSSRGSPRAGTGILCTWFSHLCRLPPFAAQNGAFPPSLAESLPPGSTYMASTTQDLLSYGVPSAAPQHGEYSPGPTVVRCALGCAASRVARGFLSRLCYGFLFPSILHRRRVEKGDEEINGEAEKETNRASILESRTSYDFKVDQLQRLEEGGCFNKPISSVITQRNSNKPYYSCRLTRNTFK